MKHQDLEKTDDQLTIDDVRRAIVKFCKFVKMLDQLKLEQFGECITAAGIKPQTQKTECRVSPRNAAAQHISAPMPKEFQTAEAKHVLDKLVVAGLLTEDYMPGCMIDKVRRNEDGTFSNIKRPLKKYEIAVLAQRISTEILCRNDWKFFEDFWGMGNISSTFYKSLVKSDLKKIYNAINNALKH